MLVKQYNYISKEDSILLIDSIKNTRHKVIVLLMLDCGLRVSEACSLKFKNFDFKNRLITLQSLKKKGNKSLRTIPMSDRLYKTIGDYLHSYKLKLGPENFIFPSNNEKGYLSRKAIWATLALYKEKLNINELHPHALRHTFATHHLASGTSLAEIKEMLGHKNYNTTLIYAEIPTETLIQRVNQVTAPPLNWYQKILRKIRKEKKGKLINIDFTENYFTIGRNEELQQLNNNINKGINTLVIGGIGSGKSHILKNIETDKKILKIDDHENIKKTLSQILLYLYKDTQTVLSIIWKDFTIDEVNKKIQRENIINLCDTINSSVQDKEYILVIDDISNITPTGKKAIERLKDKFIIVAGAREIKAQNTSFIWNFEKIEIKNLNRKYSLQLINQLSSNVEVENIEVYRNHIFEQTNGNPRAITELIDRYKKEPFLDIQTIREIKHTGALREIDMTFMIVIFLAVLTSLKFLARDMDEPALRYIGSMAMIALLLIRPLMKNLKRQFV